jgi:hypothetical protein
MGAWGAWSCELEIVPTKDVRKCVMSGRIRRPGGVGRAHLCEEAGHIQRVNAGCAGLRSADHGEIQRTRLSTAEHGRARLSTAEYG